MNAQEMNGWLYYGGGIELWHEVYEPFNRYLWLQYVYKWEVGLIKNLTINDFKGLNANSV